MSILLSHGYFLFEDEKERRVMKPYAPLGLLYLSSYLKQQGIKAEVYDSTFGTLQGFRDKLVQSDAPVVGLYVNLMTKFNILQMIGMAKAAGRSVVLGGPEPVNYAEEYIQYGADVVVAGEGELTLTGLLRRFQGGAFREMETVPGIIFRDSSGRIVRTGTAPQVSDLSSVPWPDRDAIDMQTYLEVWKKHHGYTSISVLTARGCPYTCMWCSHSVFGFTHRRRSVSDVAKEVKALVEKYGPDQLWYADDVLTIHPSWFRSYAEELQSRGVHVPFECISRADRLNEETVALLAQMGCRRLWIGSESGSQRILDRMKRRANAADVRQKTHMLQSAGIEVGMFIMFGYDGETIEDIRETARHLELARPDEFLSTVAYPIKGTAYYDEVVNAIRSPRPWKEMTDRDYVVGHRYSLRFYKAAIRWVTNRMARIDPNISPWRRIKSWMAALSGYLGMLVWARLTRRSSASQGQGWTIEERAHAGW